MAIIDEIKMSFQKGTMLTRLIYINLFVFLFIWIIFIFIYLFNVVTGKEDFANHFLPLLSVPAYLPNLAVKPWTLITYMFTHFEFRHLLSNLLFLYFFGRIFLQYFNGKNLLGVYLLGGISGAFLYILVFNSFPRFKEIDLTTGVVPLEVSIALGASASVMAVIFAVSVYAPNYKMNLIFIGPIKIIYIALVAFVLTSILDISSNTGGKLAHIGGALFGYLFIVQYRKGKDMTKFISRLLDAIAGWFKPKPRIKVSHRKTKDDLEYNKRKKDEQAEVDRILDKIAKAGYDSLTKQEKETLFKQSQK